MSTTTESATNKAYSGWERPLRDLAHFLGDLEQYRHWTGRLIYTPGVQHLREGECLLAHRPGRVLATPAQDCLLLLPSMETDSPD